MWLAIDDIRTFDSPDVVVTRSFKASIKALETKEWEGLYLDHDLGQLSNGADILKRAIRNDCLPNIVVFITQNPVGLKNMQNIIEDYGYKGDFNKRVYKGL